MTDFDVELPYKTAATGRQTDNALSNGGIMGCGVGGSNPENTINGVALSSSSNLGMDKSTLKVHLTDGSFNVVRFGDATDIKVSLSKMCSKTPQ